MFILMGLSMIDAFYCFQILVVIRPGRPSRPRSASGRRCGSPAGRLRAARSRTLWSGPWALSSTGRLGRVRGRSSISLLVTSGRRGRFLRLLRGRRRVRRTRGPTTSSAVSSFQVLKLNSEFMASKVQTLVSVFEDKSND